MIICEVNKGDINKYVELFFSTSVEYILKIVLLWYVEKKEIYKSFKIIKGGFDGDHFGTFYHGYIQSLFMSFLYAQKVQVKEY